MENLKELDGYDCKHTRSTSSKLVSCGHWEEIKNCNPDGKANSPNYPSEEWPNECIKEGINKSRFRSFLAGGATKYMYWCGSIIHHSWGVLEGSFLR